MSNAPLISQDVANRTIADALRLHVGRGKRHSIQGIADAIGYSESSVYGYQQGTATPGMAALMALMAVLGPGFASEVLRPCGLRAAADDADMVDPHSLLTCLIGGAGALSKALEDGRIDHRERLELKPIAQNLIEALQPLARGDG